MVVGAAVVVVVDLTIGQALQQYTLYKGSLTVCYFVDAHYLAGGEPARGAVRLQQPLGAIRTTYIITINEPRQYRSICVCA